RSMSPDWLVTPALSWRLRDEQGQISCGSRPQRGSTRHAILFDCDAKIESAFITRRKCGRKCVETNCRERFVLRYRDVLAKDRDDVAHSSSRDGPNRL